MNYFIVINIIINMMIYMVYHAYFIISLLNDIKIFYFCIHSDYEHKILLRT